MAQHLLQATTPRWSGGVIRFPRGWPGGDQGLRRRAACRTLPSRVSYLPTTSQPTTFHSPLFQTCPEIWSRHKRYLTKGYSSPRDFILYFLMHYWCCYDDFRRIMKHQASNMPMGLKVIRLWYVVHVQGWGQTNKLVCDSVLKQGHRGWLGRDTWSRVQVEGSEGSLCIETQAIGWWYMEQCRRLQEGAGWGSGNAWLRSSGLRPRSRSCWLPHTTFHQILSSSHDQANQRTTCRFWSSKLRRDCRPLTNSCTACTVMAPKWG